jgi:hypothetical protein
MKKNLLLFVAIFTVTILFTSCKKEKAGEDKITNITLDVSINAGETYNLDLSKYGDADDVATITTQAANYLVSEITKTAVIGNYSFMKAGSPKAGGNGNETVVLKVAEGQRGNGNTRGNEHGGKQCHKDETNITINFTVL